MPSWNGWREVTKLVVAVLGRLGRMPRCLSEFGKTGSVDVSAVRAPQLGLISFLGVWSHRPHGFVGF